jgi:hypothetical protein
MAGLGVIEGAMVRTASMIATQEWEHSTFKH